MKKAEINKIINLNKLEQLKKDIEKRQLEIDNCDHYLDKSLFNPELDFNNILSIYKYCPKCGGCISRKCV